MTLCNRCGVELAPGSLKYVVTIHVIADFDGVLPAQVEMEDLEAFMRQMDEGDPVELEKDVYQSKGYLLCPVCKANFLKDPLGLAADQGQGADEGGRVH